MSTPRTVGDVVAGIDRQLARWRVWFPNEESEVAIPRCDLLLLVEAARKTLPAPLPETRTAPVVAPTDPAFTPLTTHAERLSLRVGDVIAVAMDDGSLREFTVRHPAWQLAHGDWVIALGEMAGGYDLSRVRGVRKAVSA